MKNLLLAVVLLAGGFQAGRLAERATFPCRVQPLSRLMAPLLGKQMPSKELCALILKLPQF
ncbi:MAG: hypothetical protein FJ050_03885 [Cyanobacteria bacterium M_surface_7_m2_040]|nr:hypothetical protein [Cyanobacteria bacterium K_Offshore_0m_m2_072]MBM5827184.1 hypothetical protein [Cyanobacteria bacterium M_surface_7_m2_040]